MPIYEYSCDDCGHDFELLVIRDVEPECPACGERSLTRLLSLPRVKSETTRDLAMRAAKKRDKTQARDRMHERLDYERNHD